MESSGGRQDAEAKAAYYDAGFTAAERKLSRRITELEGEAIRYQEAFRQIDAEVERQWRHGHPDIFVVIDALASVRDLISGSPRRPQADGGGR